MTPADAMVYLAAHRGQGRILLDAIDPSVVDERDPLSCEPAPDMYDTRNGFVEPPDFSSYSAAFLERYRAAQVERVRVYAGSAMVRCTTRLAGPPSQDHLDHGIDPSEREYGSLLSERPDLMNMAALGFARTVTPRAWLSTWSGLSSNADLVVNVAAIAEPTLIVHAERDREIRPSDAAFLLEACAAKDKQLVIIPGARHYFESDPGERDAPHVEAAMNAIVPWIEERVA
jgi:pimeloyl-ACP methyl ester carboxylesterase